MNDEFGSAADFGGIGFFIMVLVIAVVAYVNRDKIKAKIKALKEKKDA